jgi:hypothetical protein
LFYTCFEVTKITLPCPFKSLMFHLFLIHKWAKRRQRKMTETTRRAGIRMRSTWVIHFRYPCDSGFSGTQTCSKKILCVSFKFQTLLATVNGMSQTFIFFKQIILYVVLTWAWFQKTELEPSLTLSTLRMQ